MIEIGAFRGSAKQMNYRIIQKFKQKRTGVTRLKREEQQFLSKQKQIKKLLEESNI